MSKKALQFVLFLSILSLLACSKGVQRSESLGSAKLSSDSQEVINGVIPEYDGIGIGLTISTVKENIKNVPANSIWPTWIEVEIINDKGAQVWKRTFTERDGFEVLRGRNLCMWELLPAPERREMADPYLRPLIPLDSGLEYSIRLNVGQIPAAPFEVEYRLEILQAERPFWHKLFRQA